MSKGRKPTPCIERIMRRLVVDGECWIWPGANNSNGYGVILDDGPERRMVYVHRKMYEATHGDLPDGVEVDHLCSNRRCCHPAHLDAVTHAENLYRGGHSNFVTRRTGVCKRGHKVEGGNVEYRADGRAMCRACRNLRKKEWIRRKREH